MPGAPFPSSGVEVAEKLYIDFETRSTVDLREAGVHKYAEDHTTDILCIGYAFDDGAIHVCRPEELTKNIRDHVTTAKKVIAHNAQFELAIWNGVGFRKYFWPKLAIEQLDCTMARAYAMSLPGSLDGASAAVGIETRKDMQGHRLMMKMSQPKKILRDHPSDAGFIVWHTEPEQFERLFEYCRQDVAVERELDKRLVALCHQEKLLWWLDQHINNRGVAVDRVSAAKALAIVESETKELDARMRDVTGNAVATCKAHVQLKSWLLEKGVTTEGVAKDAILQILASDVPEDVRTALEIRQEAAKSSTAKLKSLIAGACSDTRLRGLFQYHAAGTGRWGGRRFQPQNLPRPSRPQKEIDLVFEFLKLPVKEAQEAIEILCGSPMTVISECLRGFLTARDRYTLLAADFSAIEARVLAWLANEITVLNLFRSGGQVYEKAAADIFGVPMDHVTKEQRQIGKVAVLALGFGGGVGAFQAMARGYGVKMAPALKYLWNKADLETREKAINRWEKEKTKAGISKQEWLSSELTKLAWRESNANIVAYWTNVEIAAINAVERPGEMTTVTPLNLPPVRFMKKGSFLWCQLPSGRALCYPYPEIKRIKTPWDTEKRTLTYLGESTYTRKWERQKTYGGKLVENITQATARDVMASAMLRVSKLGYGIVLHVHDEIVVEVPEDRGQALQFAELVQEVPEWAAGLPIAAEGWRGKRYRK